MENRFDLDEAICIECGKKVFEQGKSYVNGLCEKCEVKMMKNIKKDVEEEKGLEVETMEALMKAKQAFEGYLDGLGYDPAYWRIKFIADGLSVDLKDRLWRVVYDGDQICKEDE
jgi:predicted  nucleic acid-binding Zn-ribbon protein